MESTNRRVTQVNWMDREVADLLDSFDPADYEGSNTDFVARELYDWWKPREGIPSWFGEQDKTYMLRKLKAGLE